jgi:iron complex outermembrane recepter protein
VLNQWQPVIYAGAIVLCAGSIAQAQTATITNIQLIERNQGLEILLETPNSAALQPTTAVQGKTLVVTIPNAQLQLPNNQPFEEIDPTPSIQSITVTQVEGTVQIRITGDVQPKVAISSAPQGLTLGLKLTQVAQEEAEEEEIVATGARERSRYQAPNSTTGTRTDTPILNVPQSIQVVPRQVIEDRGTRSISDGLRNVSGVNPGRISPESQALSPVIRGFQSENVLRNGLRDDSIRFSNDVANIERIEVLKGPASVLFGQGDLSGTVNVITKQPLDRPFYSIGYQAGQFNLHRPTIDFSSPLGNSGLAYRLNAAYQRSDSFKPFEESNSIFIAPVVTLVNDGKTKLTIELENLRSNSSGTAPELPASGTVVANPNGRVAFDANLGEPSIVESESVLNRLGYQFEHRFNPDWIIRNELILSSFDTDTNNAITNIRLGRDERTLTRLVTVNPSSQSNLGINTSLTGKFRTGSVEHQVLIGAEFGQNRFEDIINFRTLSTIDIFNPVYRPDRVSNFVIRFQDTETQKDALGLYLQDQISLSRNLILVLGGRFDTAKQQYEDRLNPQESFERTDSVFSPRAGLVFKPSENLSLYTSYSRSFTPVIGRSRILDINTGDAIVGDPFEPERGSQVEAGIKASLFNNRVSTTLAFFQLERSNVTTSGSLNDTVSQVQIGEQRSRGIELDIAGEILPGWNVIASYTHTNAEVTEDNRFPVGNKLPNVPKNAFSLWTTYEIQSGSLRGLGFGLGLFAQGKRPGDLENSFTLPSYLRTDASIFYRRNNLRAAINVQNLFDNRYFEGARNNVRVIPGAPLTVSGSLSWEF